MAKKFNKMHDYGNESRAEDHESVLLFKLVPVEGVVYIWIGLEVLF